MHILTIHSDYIKVEPQAKALESGYDQDAQPFNAEDALVVFISVEKGDEFNEIKIVENTTKEILSIYNQVKAKEIVIYPYSHLSSNLAPAYPSNKILNALVEKIKEIAPVKKAPFGYYKAFELRCKGHPLSELSREITVEKENKEEQNLALKAEEKLKSYWYILNVDGKLTPAEEFDFTSHENLKKFVDYEVKKVRTYAQTPAHVIYMRALELVDYESGSDVGNLRWYPKGSLIKRLLEEKINNTMFKLGGMQVETPIMYDLAHPQLHKYLNRFPNRHYLVKSGDKDLFLRFSACFGQYLISQDMVFSYKQLPIKLYELTHYSFRKEQKGELVGLKRLRAFTMPDMHTLVADMNAAKKEFYLQYKASMDWMNDIELPYEVGIRFVKDFYYQNEDFAKELVSTIKKPVLIEMWDERPFYFVMKFEFNFIDASDKASALSTVQIDVENTERFDINYIDKDGEKKYPIMLHASISGAIDRNIYALLEKAHLEQKKGNISILPLWLSPTQIRILPISSENHLKFAENLANKLEKQNIRVDIDDTDATLGKKIMKAEQEWVPYQIVVGDKEQEDGENSTLQIRARADNGKIFNMSVANLIKKIKKETKERPFKPLPLPRLISKRPKFVG